MKNVIPVLLSFCCSQAFAKLEQVPFSEHCTAKIDTKVISKENFQDIQKLSQNSYSNIVLWGDLDFKNGLEKASDLKPLLEKKKIEISHQFFQHKKELKNLKIGKAKIWNTVRDQRIEQLTLTTDFFKAQLNYLKTNNLKSVEKIVKNLKFSETCERYLTPLKSLTELKKFAPDFAKEKCENNGYKEDCLKDITFSEDSPALQAKLKFQILNLGLANCANIGNKEVWTDHHEQELKKLVTDIKCQEP
jgi:hypothetical protein